MYNGKIQGQEPVLSTTLTFVLSKQSISKMGRVKIFYKQLAKEISSKPHE